ncbi:multidrug resistance outer membrane protein MdtQ [compost metagenome]
MRRRLTAALLGALFLSANTGLVPGLTLPAAGAAEMPAARATTPLTLEAAITRALSTHPDAVIAQTQVAQAGISVADISAQRLQFSADASVLGRHAQTGLLANNAAGTTTDQTGINGTVGMTVPIFTGGKLMQGLRAAERNRDAVAFQGAMTRADLTYEVTRAYWNLARQEALTQVQQETIVQAQRALSLTKASFGLGRLTSNDVDRAEVDALNTQDALLRLQAQAQEARVRLAVLVGLPVSELAIAPEASKALTALPLVTETKAGPMLWPDPDAVIAEHPRVLAAQARVEAARASVAAAHGDRWPQLSLITTYQHGNNPFDPLSGARGLGSFSGTWDARVSANLNVFDNGRIGREVAKAEAELAIAEANLTKTQRDVRSGVELALIRVRSAQERAALAGRSSGVAAKTLTWVETRYEQGYSLLVEVHDSRRSLLTARTQRIEAEVDYQIARAELALARGRTE